MTRRPPGGGPWLVALAVMMLAGCAFAQAPGGSTSATAPAVATAQTTASPAEATTALVPSSRPSPESPASESPASPSAVALPACRYDDVPVDVDPATDWATVVVDTIYRLPKRYAPDDLVSTGKAGLNTGYKVSRVVIDDLRAMARAARAAGAGLAVQSAFRSYQYQVTTFNGWVARSSEAEARTLSARPGHSEHQLGTALDFRSADDPTPPWQLDDFADTAAGAWLRDHAWVYGFVLSYPKGASADTCYAYEPWHYRYVGRGIAAAIHASGQAPRRYLWSTYGPGAG